MLPQTEIFANLIARMATFRRASGTLTLRKALALVAGTFPAPGRRTVSAALRSMGLNTPAHFTNDHRFSSGIDIRPVSSPVNS
jgi:hypothetical protein